MATKRPPPAEAARPKLSLKASVKPDYTLHLAQDWYVNTIPPKNTFKVSFNKFQSTVLYCTVRIILNPLLHHTVRIIFVNILISFKQGAIVPKIFSKSRRRISIEVYRFHDIKGGYYDECFLR